MYLIMSNTLNFYNVMSILSKTAKNKNDNDMYVKICGKLLKGNQY